MYVQVYNAFVSCLADIKGKYKLRATLYYFTFLTTKALMKNT